MASICAFTKQNIFFFRTDKGKEHLYMNCTVETPADAPYERVSRIEKKTGKIVIFGNKTFSVN